MGHLVGGTKRIKEIHAEYEANNNNVGLLTSPATHRTAATGSITDKPSMRHTKSPRIESAGLEAPGAEKKRLPAKVRWGGRIVKAAGAVAICVALGTLYKTVDGRGADRGYAQGVADQTILGNAANKKTQDELSRATSRNELLERELNTEQQLSLQGIIHISGIRAKDGEQNLFVTVVKDAVDPTHCELEFEARPNEDGSFTLHADRHGFHSDQDISSLSEEVRTFENIC